MPVATPPFMSSIKNEFQGPNNLRAYNRNGTYVPTNSYNNNISTDPNALKISQYAGARKEMPVSFSSSVNEEVLTTGNSPYLLAHVEVKMNGEWIVNTTAQSRSGLWYTGSTAGLTFQQSGALTGPWIDGYDGHIHHNSTTRQTPGSLHHTYIKYVKVVQTGHVISFYLKAWDGYKVAIP